MKKYVIILAIALTSCHILTKNKLSLKKLNQKEEFQLVEERNIRSEQNQLLMIDSSHSDFTVWLWPKGNFTFSPTIGFQGEAEKIVVNGKQKNQKMLYINNALKKDSTNIKANYQNQKQESTRTKKAKLKVGPSWAWLLLIPILFLSYLAYRRLSWFINLHSEHPAHK